MGAAATVKVALGEALVSVGLLCDDGREAAAGEMDV